MGIFQALQRGRRFFSCLQGKGQSILLSAAATSVRQRIFARIDWYVSRVSSRPPGARGHSVRGTAALGRVVLRRAAAIVRIGDGSVASTRREEQSAWERRGSARSAERRGAVTARESAPQRRRVAPRERRRRGGRGAQSAVTEPSGSTDPRSSRSRVRSTTPTGQPLP